MCVISLCTRGALDAWSRGRSTAALGDTVATSVHDHTVVGYTVDALRRQLILRTEFESSASVVERCEVTFSDVEAYCLEHDRLGTILFDIREVPAVSLFDNNLARFESGHRLVGWPRFWKTSAEDARRYLVEHKTRGFEISASIGMSGWVLAGGFQIASSKGVA